MNIMNIIVWIVFGALAGWVASMFAGSNRGQGLLGDIIVGIVGAFVGGWIMEFFGQAGVTGFNLYSFAVAVIGAVLVLFIKRKLLG